MKTTNTKPKIKPTTTKKQIPTPAAIAATEAGMWKSSVDLTLVRHGKEITRQAGEIAAATHNLKEYRRAMNTHNETLSDVLDSLRSHSGHLRELREAQQYHRVILSVNLFIILGLLAAVAYILFK
jgi:hypothetical protein